MIERHASTIDSKLLCYLWFYIYSLLDYLGVNAYHINTCVKSRLCYDKNLHKINVRNPMGMKLL